ncbi:hypothetical protein GOP47_0023923 [Adiantum capillus-veneris]|uniref:Uncharacterized protein n=1 Tax=Adiantum capillus-veneris TaxID=13818 RepID=A0A9D4Z3T5_ADICA|nr:hypothetical protein GOP47_0023923 [Adiantum capillus-veneris]
MGDLSPYSPACGGSRPRSCSAPVVLPCLHGVVENMLACVAWLFSLVYGTVGRVLVPCLSAVMRCCGLSSCSPICGGFWLRLCSVVLLCGCLVFLVRWSMVDWGRALVLCCSVSRGCAALFSRLLRRSEVALQNLVSCCSVDSGRAALFGRRLLRSMVDLGCRSVVLLLFLVMSCCIAVLFVHLWWIGSFCIVPCCSMLRGFAALLGRLVRRPVMVWTPICFAPAVSGVVMLHCRLLRRSVVDRGVLLC